MKFQSILLTFHSLLSDYPDFPEYFKYISPRLLKHLNAMCSANEACSISKKIGISNKLKLIFIYLDVTVEDILCFSFPLASPNFAAKANQIILVPDYAEGDDVGSQQIEME